VGAKLTAKEFGERHGISTSEVRWMIKIRNGLPTDPATGLIDEVQGDAWWRIRTEQGPRIFSGYPQERLLLACQSLERFVLRLEASGYARSAEACRALVLEMRKEVADDLAHRGADWVLYLLGDLASAGTGTDLQGRGGPKPGGAAARPGLRNQPKSEEAGPADDRRARGPRPGDYIQGLGRRLGRVDPDAND
jgi:hypothetical protein